ncbi:SHOCT domain-containing protein [Chryseobacterium sp. BIGb0232]|uniref:SHOCT domain-containing protein n=1 Tax=Chryseobacterium sp. BIGb0232 TaxID=2940598 RepID=UPI000F47E6B5|nr:SHOCT domain-containing protein [Chryseobacterium sp. BIGb0232]MCS4304727.1 hypothetical protein [Chryseobacterium sp. BIGb0232]ROS20616.1 PH (Pleckstrin Homology) domain-containing protein [Chryseobacterium nakagawai]
MEKCIGCLAPFQNTGFFSTKEELADHTYVCNSCGEQARKALANMYISTTIFSSCTAFQVRELLVKGEQFEKFYCQIVNDYTSISLFQSSLINKLFISLLEGEKIVIGDKAVYENKSGALFVTNKRLLFVTESSPVGFPEVIDYHDIVSVDMINSDNEIRIITSDNSLRFLKILWTEKFQKQIKKQIELSKKSKQEKVIPSQNNNDSSLFDILERLGSFRQNGVITDVEFAEQKKKLLERL